MMAPRATRCTSSSPATLPRSVRAREGRPLRTKRSMRSTSASARSIRPSDARWGAAVVALATPETAVRLPTAPEGPRNAGGAAVPATMPGARSLLAVSSARSAVLRRSTARVSSRPVAWSVATAPSATRRRAEVSISWRAWPRSSPLACGARAATRGARAGVAVLCWRGGAGGFRVGRSMRPRSSSSNRFRGGTGGESLRGASTRSGCMPKRVGSRFVPSGLARTTGGAESSSRDDHPVGEPCNRCPRSASTRGVRVLERAVGA